MQRPGNNDRPLWVRRQAILVWRATRQEAQGVGMRSRPSLLNR